MTAKKQKEQLTEYNERMVSRTDWPRLRRMRAGLEPIDFSDIPELDSEWFRTAYVGKFVIKKPISIRVDHDVIKWFKRLGPRYQSRMNDVLRAYMLAHQSPKQRRKAG